MTGFLALEPDLVQRIETAVIVPGLKVLTAAQLAGVQANAQPVPAVHVIYDGFATLRAENGLAEIVERWLTVVAVRNVRSARSGADARADAGPILDGVFAALYGWQVSGVKPLQPILPPRPGFDAGFGYYPLAWAARLAKIPQPCPLHAAQL